MTLLVRGAVAVVRGDGVETAGDVEVDDGQDVVTVLDATGCVVTPGLVNAHHHLAQSAFRTLPGTRGVPMAQWLPTMAAAYAEVGLDPELIGAAAAVAVAEGLLCGVTTVADHMLNWPFDASLDLTVEMAAAVVAAAAHLGSRLVFVRGSARDDAVWAAESARAIAEELVPVGGVSADGMLQVAVGPAGAHSDARETFDAMAEVARDRGLRRRTQANEQVDVAIALDRYGRRPIELLGDWGWLAPDVTLAHLVDLLPDEVAALATAGVTGTHAPGFDVPMGWGVSRVGDLRAAGIAVGLGTSGGGLNDAGHLLADGRLALQVSALTGSPLSARDVLEMATRGSATGLGRPDLGHLGEGSAGDLCVWDVSGVADAGVADPVAGLLWAAPGRRPRDVVVGGRVVVRDHVLRTADERAVAARLSALLAVRRSG
ncbi:amidohydrolase family protein [Nocardioides mangrovi]|uniref:Amidohydrolase family protein n=1 Tax=Nocardioides mangrovi TaxID=2874580 RepID=A0ABS7UC38_9ACTN|nr:amidohydrolase family protein [Nocardioides mangrovi]MBZ5738442.1 amidohydrolase family protein [Nocardioides mangrovi]